MRFQTFSDIYAKTSSFKLFSEKDLNKQLRHKTKNTIKTAVGFYFCFPTKTRQNQTLKPKGVVQCFSNNETNHAKADKSSQIKTHCGFTAFFQQPNQTRQNQTKPDKTRQIKTHMGFRVLFQHPDKPDKSKQKQTNYNTLWLYNVFRTTTPKQTKPHKTTLGFVWFCLVLCCFAGFCFGFVCLLPCFLASLFSPASPASLLPCFSCFPASPASLACPCWFRV